MIENEDSLRDLKATIKRYDKFILTARIVDPDEDFHVISAWLAQYVKLRGWRTNQRRNEPNRRKL